MSGLTRAKLALGVVGLILFAYGVRADDELMRLVGIGCLAVGTLLRWWPRPRPPAG